MDFWDLFKRFFSLSPAITAANVNSYIDEQKVNHILNGASDDPIGAQGQLANSGLSVSPEQEKYLDNLISIANTNSARDFETHMRDTDYLSVGKQLQQLGLSASGVLQTGASHNAVAAADNVKTNMALQMYNQRMAIAKQLLGMTSQMASAGVYGHAIGQARTAASVLSSAAAHSAYGAMNDPYLKAQNYRNDQMWDDLVRQGIVK